MQTLPTSVWLVFVKAYIFGVRGIFLRHKGRREKGRNFPNENNYLPTRIQHTNKTENDK